MISVGGVGSVPGSRPDAASPWVNRSVSSTARSSAAGEAWPPGSTSAHAGPRRDDSERLTVPGRQPQPVAGHGRIEAVDQPSHDPVAVESESRPRISIPNPPGWP
jgi:hypothetical protein